MTMTREMNLGYAITVAYVFAWQLVTPLIPLYLVALSTGPIVVGSIIAASGLFSLAAGIYIGRLVDEYGPSRLAKLSAIVYCGFLFILALVPSLVGVLGLVGVLAAYTTITAGQVGLTLAIQVMIAKYSAGADRDRNFAYYGFWSSIGMIGGPIIGGILVDISGFRTAFLAAGALGLSTLLISAKLETLPQQGKLERYRLVGTAASLLHRRNVLLVVGIAFAFMFAQSLRQSFYPIYLDGIGMSTTLIGLLLGIQSASSMLVRLMYAAAVRSIGYGRLLLWGLIVSAIGIGVVPLVGTLPLLSLASIMTGTATGFIQTLTTSLAGAAADQQMVGLVLSLRLTAQRMATIVSPLVFGLLVEAFGIASAFYIGALVLVGAALLLRRSQVILPLP